MLGATFTRNKRVFDLLMCRMVKSSLKDFELVKNVYSTGGGGTTSRKRNPLRITKYIWLRE